MFLAEVVAVHVDEKYMDEKNAFHMDDIGMFAYEHGTYRELGDKLGTFGYAVRKKPADSKQAGKKVDSKTTKSNKPASKKADSKKAKSNKPACKNADNRKLKSKNAIVNNKAGKKTPNKKKSK